MFDNGVCRCDVSGYEKRYKRAPDNLKEYAEKLGSLIKFHRNNMELYQRIKSNLLFGFSNVIQQRRI